MDKNELSIMGRTSCTFHGHTVTILLGSYHSRTTPTSALSAETSRHIPLTTAILSDQKAILIKPSKNSKQQFPWNRQPSYFQPYETPSCLICDREPEKSPIKGYETYELKRMYANHVKFKIREIRADGKRTLKKLTINHTGSICPTCLDSLAPTLESLLDDHSEHLLAHRV